ncbi:MAG: hypothetical protein L0154_00620 [Chloroflexi bacterium]|nr:hypothetical protein [Chloroflexota bacterium]
MSFDDDLLEGLDEFEDPFAGDGFEDFDDEAGPSPIFLIAGGLIVATFLVLLVIVILLISSGGGPGNEDDDNTATAVVATNDAVELLLNVTRTRIAVVEVSETVGAANANGTATAEVIQTGTAQVEQGEVLLDASRTAIVVNATNEQATINAEIGATSVRETQIVQSMTPPTATATIPPTAIIVFQDESGNPLPGGVEIIIYRDDGDGVFNPVPPAGPTPTPPPLPPTDTPIPTVPPTRVRTPTPSRTPTLAPGALIEESPTVVGTPIEGAGAGAEETEEVNDGGPAGFNAEAGGDRIVFARVIQVNADQVVQQEGTPTQSLGVTETVAPGVQEATAEVTEEPIAEITVEVPSAEGDVQVATVLTLPDGSFIVQGLPPGLYFFQISGEIFPFEVQLEPTEITVTINGIPVTFYIIPNVTFPTLTPTSIPQEALDATATSIAQMTMVASQFPTFQTVVSDPDVQTALAIVEQTNQALGTAGAGTSTGFTPPATIDDTGFFDDLAQDASPGGLTFLAVMAGALMVGIVTIRRLRAAI